MNCIQLFVSRCREEDENPALWMHQVGTVTFSDLRELAQRAQRLCRNKGVRPGDGVLLFEGIGPRLYASILGILAMGASVVLVEPWMKVGDLHRIVATAKPKLFLTNSLGKLWGLRIPSVRSIPAWAGVHTLKQMPLSKGLHLESVDEDTPAVMVFTSGTSGTPKGIVRTHGSLTQQHRILTRDLDLEGLQGPDLSIFANFVLSNLASGRCSVIIPHKWPEAVLRRMDTLPDRLQPESLACGPAFLKRLMGLANVRRLKSIHVGGALSDCDVLEQGFRQWPEAQWRLVYGSSEAEPVAVTDARPAVRKSRNRGCFQTLFLGEPIPEISSSLEADSLWVAGPHVCGLYVANESANLRYKRKDQEGRIWHCMGDRVVSDEDGWWFAGRSEQPPQDFQLEQKIYSMVGSSDSFIHRNTKDERFLLGSDLTAYRDRILNEHGEIRGVQKARVYRDRRHRAKIDRRLSVKKGAPWIAG